MRLWWWHLKFERPLLPRSKLSPKNKVVLLMRFEVLNCPYYPELKFSKWYDSFHEVTWKFALPLSSRSKVFTKIKQFCWSDSKTWTAPIITSSNFLKKKAVLLKWFENLNYPQYHELKISQKSSSFLAVIRKLEVPNHFNKTALFLRKPQLVI